MTARCPDCGSRSIGFPVPDSACAVRIEGEMSRVTLCSATTGALIHTDDLDHEHAKCLDCEKRFDATDRRPLPLKSVFIGAGMWFGGIK